MKVAFICDLPAEHFPFWNDGLKAAIEVLRDKYSWTIDVFNGVNGLEPDNYDVGVIWSSLTNPITNYRYFDKQVLCFGGGPTFSPNIHNFDYVFAESEVDYKDFKRFGKKTSQAFGTNTKLFRPMPEQPKVFGFLYPASFAKWKHHEKFAEYVKNEEKDAAKGIEILDDEYVRIPALAVGYMQPNGWEKECYEVCQENGITVMPQVPYDVMPYIINAAEAVYVGADIDGGCQRTILEAKACDVEVIVDSDSPKLIELKDLTRDDVLERYSEEAYAKSLKDGIESIMKNG